MCAADTQNELIQRQIGNRLAQPAVLELKVLTRRVPLGKPRSIFGRNQVGHSQPARIAVPLEPGNALETRDMLIEDFNTRATEQ
jgi:hypothetical protein